MATVPDNKTIVFEVGNQEIINGWQKVCGYRLCDKEFISKTKHGKYCCDSHKVLECKERAKDRKRVDV